jgi:putative MFS transporter
MHLFSIKPIRDEEGGPAMQNYPRGRKYKYTEVIKEIGFGPYQYKIVATVALLNCAMGIYIALLSFLIPLYKSDVFINKWEVGILVSTQGLASLLGGLFFSYISDMCGRRFSLVAALITVISCSFICTIFDTFIPFCATRFIGTIGYGGIMPVSVTYLTEYLPDNSRGFYIIGIDIFRSAGGLLAISAAWLSGENWRTFVISPVPLFALGLIVIVVLLPESSRYLLYKNKTEQLEKNLNDMCRQNGKKFTVRYSLNDEHGAEHIKHKREVSICRDLIVNKWDTTVPLMMLWFFPAFGTGVYVFLPEIMLLKGFTMDQIYILSSYLMIAPMCGIVVSSLFIDTLGRKQVISMCALISGLSLFTFTLVSEEAHKISMFYIILGTFSIFMRILKSVTTAYTPELYSTSTRTTALGVMNGLDRAASIIQPVIFTSLVYYSFKLAMAGFGAPFLIGFMVSLTLQQETVNKPLKESFLSECNENDVGASALRSSMVVDTN